VHDCSDGGLAVAFAEMAIAGDVGFRVALAATPGGGPTWFSESASRVVLSVEPGRVAEVLGRARDANVPAAELGEAGGARLSGEDAFEVELTEAAGAWRDALRSAVGAGTVI
jgi:phosphoribosylformylglycinamidine synthase subunit PurL